MVWKKPVTLCSTLLTTSPETTMTKDELAYYQLDGCYWDHASVHERYSYEQNKSDTYDDPDSAYWVDNLQSDPQG